GSSTGIFDVAAEATLKFDNGEFDANDGTVFRGAGIVQVDVNGSAVLATNGTVRADNTFLKNDGTVQVQTGLLTVGTGASTGDFDVEEDAELQFVNGEFDANDGTLFEGSGQAQVGGDPRGGELYVGAG